MNEVYNKPMWNQKMVKGYMYEYEQGKRLRFLFLQNIESIEDKWNQKAIKFNSVEWGLYLNMCKIKRMIGGTMEKG